MASVLKGANLTAQWYQDTYLGLLFAYLEKVCLHTTETKGWPGYSGGASAPNATYHPLLRQIRQHFENNRSARALRDPSSTPVRENRDRVWQLEIVAYSDYALARSVGGLWIGDLTDAHYTDIAWMLIQLNKDLKLPLTSSIRWAEGQKTYVSGRRLSSSGWDACRGIATHFAVSGNCVAADTPVLCSDLTWRPAGELLPGDELIAFDEASPGQTGRRLRRSVVTSNEVRRDALLRVNTSKGPVRCNREHPWLVRRGRGDFGRTVGLEWGHWEWVKTENLLPGDQVCHVLDPWEIDRSWEAGWLAGMYDGEGSLSVMPVKKKDGSPGATGGVYLSCAQRVSDTADEMLRRIKERVPVYSLKRGTAGLGKTDMVQATIQKRADVLRMLGMVRPARLLAKADAAWAGASLGKISSRATVESVEPWGTGLIAALSTSTETYIADGFAMHNTHWDAGGFYYSRLAAKIKQLLGTAPAPLPEDDVNADQDAKLTNIDRNVVAITSRVLAMLDMRAAAVYTDPVTNAQRTEANKLGVAIEKLPAAVTAAVLAALPGGSVDAALVEAACERAVKNVLLEGVAPTP